MALRDIMATSPLCVSANETIGEVAHKMATANIGSVLITNADDTLEGIFTERDLLRLFRDSQTPDFAQAIRSSMTAKPLTASADDPPMEALQTMVDNRIRHIPIVDGDNKPVGIVSMRDFVAPGTLLVDADQQPGSGPSEEPRTVLIIDDSYTMRTMLRTALEDAQFTVLEAEHGMAGVRTLRTSAVDLVILDLNMPGIDGVKTISTIRATEGHKTTPIIVVTVESTPAAILQSKKAGANAIMLKPLNTPILIKEIKRILA